MKKQKTLIEDLLTENRFWTFWTLDWKNKVDIFWGGKTEWKKVCIAVKKHMKIIKKIIYVIAMVIFAIACLEGFGKVTLFTTITAHDFKFQDWIIFLMIMFSLFYTTQKIISAP